MDHIVDASQDSLLLSDVVLDLRHHSVGGHLGSHVLQLGEFGLGLGELGNEGDFLF